MAPSVSTGSNESRPATLQTAKSFTRFEPSKISPTSNRSRASTIQAGISPLHTPPAVVLSSSPEITTGTSKEDVFDKAETHEEEPASPDLNGEMSRSQSLPERFDELPIELISLTDRFIESLAAKVYLQPPTADVLSELFQDFYIKAGAHISTHISALASRLNRESSPVVTPTNIKNKPPDKKASVDTLGTSGRASAQQMLTASEVTERRKARRMLEYKRLALEEAVERRACEKVYEKIWRHGSTLDEVRDEKLRSKTAALALVGIGLKDLGIEDVNEKGKTDESLQKLLEPAREGLARMNEENFPRGKLRHLTNAHKSIVETLSTIHSSSSSADEVLPTLIYTLITSPTEGINIISNLYFVQRFRAMSKINGEAAYCMTNLEAAISFLENVDLASLRADEAPEGPGKSSSRPATPQTEKSDPFLVPPTILSSSDQPTVAPSIATASAPVANANGSTARSSSSPLPSPLHQRRLSNLLKPSTTALGAANDVVRTTAEEGLKNISNTLDNSFKFLFGKLKERNNDTNSDVILPKTLDEARQLVGQPVTPEDESMVSETSSLGEADNEASSQPSKTEDKLLAMVGGRTPGSLRERSVDSAKSSGSGKRVAFSSSNLAAPPQNSSTASANAFDSVKNLGNSLNPLTHLGSAFGSGFRGFGKSTPSPPISSEKEKASNPVESRAPMQLSKEDTVMIDGPIQRFVDMIDPDELTLRDVKLLLSDYQRLAGTLHTLRG